MTDPFSDGYADGYLLRRQASTMSKVTAEWFDDNAERLLRGASGPGARRAFSMLSVGSGDGELDLDLLGRLFPAGAARPARLRYVAVEPSRLHRERLLARAEREGAGLVTEVVAREEPFSPRALEPERFDLIVMLHVLYYIAPREPAIRHARALLAPGGCLVIVQQTATGIPELQAEFLGPLKGSTAELYTSDDVLRLLRDAGIPHEHEERDAHLDVTECLAQTEVGSRILSFCMEADVTAAPPALRAALLRALASRACPVDGRSTLREPLGFIVIPAA